MQDRITGCMRMQEVQEAFFSQCYVIVCRAMEQILTFKFLSYCMYCTVYMHMTTYFMMHYAIAGTDGDEEPNNTRTLKMSSMQERYIHMRAIADSQKDMLADLAQNLTSMSISNKTN